MQKINNAVMDGGEGLQNFANVAGVSAEEFAELWQNDPYQALMIFQKGMKGVIDSGGNAKQTLEELGIKELRETDTVLRLANGYGIMEDAQKYANEGWKEGTALSAEAEERYKTLGSQIQLFKNQLFATGRAIGEALAPYLTELMKKLTPLLKKLEEASDKTKVMIAAIAGITIVAGPVFLTISLFAGALHQLSMGMGVVSTMAKGGLGLKKLGDISKIASVSFKDLGGVFGWLVKSPLKLFTGSWGALKIALRTITGPVGIVITAVTVLSKIFITMYKELDIFKDLVDGTIAVLGSFAKFIGGALGTAVKASVGFFKDMGSSAKEAGKEIGEKLSNSLKNTYEKLPDDGWVKKWGNYAKGLNEAIKSTKEPVDALGRNVSDSTKKSLDGFIKLTEKASKKMSELRISVLSEEEKITIDQYEFYEKRGLEIPEKVQKQHDKILEKYGKHADDLRGTYEEMKNESLTKMKEKHSAEEQEMQDFIKKTGAYTDEESEEIMKRLNKRHTDSQKSTEENHNEILSIIDKGMEERGYLTEEELGKIEKLQEESNETVVQTLSEGEKEQEVILQRLGTNKLAMNRETYEKLLNDSKEARDKTIQGAEEERDALIATAMESTTLTDEEKKKAVEAAEEQYEKTVENAEKTYNEVIGHASKQAEEHGVLVDEETGEVLSAWEAYWEKTKKFLAETWSHIKEEFLRGWEEFKEWISGIWDYIVEKVELAIASLSIIYTALYDKIVEFFTGIWEYIVEKYHSFMESVGTFFTTLYEKIVEFFVGIWEYLVEKYNSFMESLTNFFLGIYESITGFFTTVWTTIVEKYNSFMESLSGFFTSVVQAFVGFFTGLWETITSWLNNTVTWISGKYEELKLNISTFMTNVRNILVNGYTEVKTRVSSIVSSFVTGIIGFFTRLWQRVTDITDKIKSFVIKVWDYIKLKVSSIVSGFKEAIVNRFTQMRTGISERIGKIKSNVHDGFVWIRDKVEGVVGKFKTKIVDIFEKMKSGIKSPIDKMKEFMTDLSDSVKKSLNKVIEGVNWVAKKIGMESQIPKLHTGTTHTTDYVSNGKISRDTFAVVGDRGRGNGPGGFRHEMIEDNKGNLTLTPSSDTIVPLKKGYKVHSGKATYDHFMKHFGEVPRFSRGTTNGGGGIFDKVKSVGNKAVNWAKNKIGDVLDYVKNPSKLFNLVLDNLGFTNFKEVTGLHGDIARTGFKAVKKNIVKKIKEWLESAEGDGGYINLSKGLNFGFAPSAAAAKRAGYPFAMPHYGLDLNYVYDKLYSTVSGTATAKQDNSGFGKHMWIKAAKGLEVIYGHMSRFAFTGSKRVKPGTYLGVSGNTGRSTGPHLHYEMRKNGRPFDPLPWLKKNNRKKKGSDNGGGGDHDHPSHDIAPDLYKKLMEQVKDSPVQVSKREFKKYSESNKAQFEDPQDRMLAILNKTVDKFNPKNLNSYANGGLIRRHQIAEVGEGNKPEMVIPLTKKARAAHLIDLARRLVGLNEDGDVEIDNSTTVNNFNVDYTERLDRIEETLDSLATAMLQLVQGGMSVQINGREVAKQTYRDTDTFIKKEEKRRGKYRRD